MHRGAQGEGHQTLGWLDEGGWALGGGRGEGGVLFFRPGAPNMVLDSHGAQPHSSLYIWSAAAFACQGQS